jgi:hypothetical protein
MGNRDRFAVVVAAVGMAASVLTQKPASAAGPQPHISAVHVERAPIGERGGIAMPTVYCTGLRVAPRVNVRVIQRETGKEKTYAWVGSYPNAYFPRVPVGHYRVVTDARCAEISAKRVEAVEVVEKTAETTMSRSEFDAITNGMTKAEVRQQVGYGGHRAGTFRGKVMRTNEDMPFWSFSIVEFSDGRVVGKYWDVDHD